MPVIKGPDGLFIVEYQIEGESFTQAFSGDELTARLSTEFERSAYGSDAWDIKGIWQYAGSGELRKVEAVHTSSYRDDNDYAHHQYVLRAPGQAEVTFTVTVDGLN